MIAAQSDYSIRMMFPAIRSTPAIAAAVLFFSAAALSCTSGKTNDVTRKNTDGLPSRIASLSPSSTLILSKLGLAGKLVAVDSWSGDIPGIPATAVRFDMMRPDAERLAALEPDLLVVSSMTKEGSALDPFKALSDSGIPVLSLATSESIDGIRNDVTAIARATGTEREAIRLIESMDRDLAEIEATVGKIPAAERKTAFFEISPAPWIYSFGRGTYLDEALSRAGLKNVMATEKGWLAVSAETVLAKNPDIILTNSDGSPDSVAEIEGRSGWAETNAVRNGKVYRVDPKTSARPTPDIVRAIRQIAEDAYPEYFNKPE